MQRQDRRLLKQILFKTIRVNQDERDAAIRILNKKYGVPQKRLAQSAGLDISSISRILASKQRKES